VKAGARTSIEPITDGHNSTLCIKLTRVGSAAIGGMEAEPMKPSK
jgi:hypothetical protein